MEREEENGEVGGQSAVEQLFGRLLSALLKNLNFHFLLQIGGENL